MYNNIFIVLNHYRLIYVPFPAGTQTLFKIQPSVCPLKQVLVLQKRCFRGYIQRLSVPFSVKLFQLGEVLRLLWLSWGMLLQSRCNFGLLFYNGSSPYCHAASRKYTCFLHDCIFAFHAVQYLQYMKLKLGEFNKNFDPPPQIIFTLLSNFKRQSLS